MLPEACRKGLPGTVVPLSAVNRALLLAPAPAPALYGIERLICGHPAFSGREIHCEPQRVSTGSPSHLRPHEGPPEPPCGFHAMVAIHQQEPIAELEHHHRRQLIQDLRKPCDLALIQVRRRIGKGVAGQSGELDIHPSQYQAPSTDPPGTLICRTVGVARSAILPVWVVVRTA